METDFIDSLYKTFSWNSYLTMKIG